MSNKDLVRIRHMLDSANAILEFTHGKTRESFLNNRLLVSGVVREFEILGEAAGRVSQDIRTKFPEIPWTDMIGMRNRLIHTYFDINHDILWKTIQKSIPILLNQLTALIGFLEE